MRVVAIIPVKATSERVKAKNFREFFNGKSLFDLLLNKLLAASEIDQVYISSNVVDLKEKVEKLGCRFIKRIDSLCNNDAPWSDVIAHVVESIPEKNETVIAWCHTTCPLFNDYDDALYQYKKESAIGACDGLVTVSKLTEFIVNEKRQPLNYSWGPWHRYSQHLETMFAITGALFVAQKQEMVRNRYVISKNPSFFEVAQMEAIDIDTPYDFELAKLLINNEKYLRTYA